MHQLAELRRMPILLNNQGQHKVTITPPTPCCPDSMAFIMLSKPQARKLINASLSFEKALPKISSLPWKMLTCWRAWQFKSLAINHSFPTSRAQFSQSLGMKCWFHLDMMEFCTVNIITLMTTLNVCHCVAVSNNHYCKCVSVLWPDSALHHPNRVFELPHTHLPASRFIEKHAE